MKFRPANCLTKIQLFLVVVALQSSMVQAWGTPSHRIIADLAWGLLSDQVKDIIVDILDQKIFFYNLQMAERCGDNEDSCTPLGTAAVWADDVKGRRGNNGPSHFVNTIDEAVADTDEDFDCPNGDCVMGDIMQYSDVLRSYLTKSNERRLLFFRFWRLGFWYNLLPAFFDNIWGSEERESLMFVTHLMGDVHQPLHCGRPSDAGGNRIEVNFMDGHNEDTALSWICPFVPRWMWNIPLSPFGVCQVSTRRRVFF